MNLNRNIVIEASAGTGKTYTLVQTILQALFEKNLKMDELVALTFTKKAAGEMKERIAAELQKVDSPQAREALEAIDRAAIGTIHSYAFSLLKRFPLAAGISPAAEVDEKGVRADDLFEKEWPAWLRKELRTQDSGLRDARQADWLEVLERVPLDAARDLARRLCDFDIPLDALPITNEGLKKELEPVYAEIRKLIAGKPEGVKSTRIAQACEEVIGAALKSHSPQSLAGNPMDSPPEAVGDDVLSALEETPGTTKDWLDEEVKKLKVIRLIALNLLQRGDRTISLLTNLLKPFVDQLRYQLLAEGILSNNALLVLARDLVAKNFQVRETLKREVRQIFIDEFQDTDPLQGELLLFLAETTGGRAKTWSDVRLEPGKLFIVGDPKQSIYLFRGADIAAYGRITAMVLEQGGERRVLEESYRSHEQIIHAVNAAFEPLIQEKSPISPAYQPLVHRRKSEDPERHLVELRLAYSKEPQSSDDALSQEAEDASAWISSNVLPPTSDVRRGTLDELRYRDIALVFRSAPAMTPFIEMLRQKNIPFVVEAERYFYRTPEVTDVMNLLRVLDEPGNRIALVGFLRSPLGGFNDAELATLQAKNGIRLEKPLPKELDAPAHHGAWELLRSLCQRVAREPLKSILNHVYDDTYLLELAARSYHRDQTIANLLKLKRLMESFAEEGETTLSGLLSKIDRFMEDDRLEGESPLADETYDAVRLLTIHKAKGLEFPVVWLPGLHRSSGGERDTTKITARFDWGTGRLGVALGRKARNMADFALSAEITEREEAEEARVLYVAMTRARDHLILSGGVCSASRYKQPAKGSFLEKLAGAWQLDLESLPEGELALGDGVITIRKSPQTAALPSITKAGGTWLDTLDAEKIAKLWMEREKNFKKAMETPLVVTPTNLAMPIKNASPPAGGRGRRATAGEGGNSRSLPPSSQPSPTLRGQKERMLGTLVHRFLEQWDFPSEKCDMPVRLRIVANHYFASEGLLKEPFPDPKNADKTSNPPELVEVVEEAQRLLADFIGSDAWEEIKGATILGREVPFFYGLNRPAPTMMRGTMDILYRLPSGQLVIGDYKTDKELDPAKYAPQAEAYQEAVQRALGEKAQFKLIYLREGSAVAL